MKNLPRTPIGSKPDPLLAELAAKRKKREICRTMEKWFGTSEWAGQLERAEADLVEVQARFDARECAKFRALAAEHRGMAQRLCVLGDPEAPDFMETAELADRVAGGEREALLLFVAKSNAMQRRSEAHLARLAAEEAHDVRRRQKARARHLHRRFACRAPRPRARRRAGGRRLARAPAASDGSGPSEPPSSRRAGGARRCGSASSVVAGGAL